MDWRVAGEALRRILPSDTKGDGVTSISLKTEARKTGMKKKHSPADPSFGEVGEKKWPFSRQLKTAIRRKFTVDRVTFDAADRLQVEAFMLATLMRLLTFAITFIPFVILSISYSLQKEIAASSAASSFEVALAEAAALLGSFFNKIDIETSVFSGLVVATIMLIVIRVIIRFIFGLMAQINVLTLAKTVSNKYGEIRHHITTCCGAVANRPERGSWPQAAKRSMKDALESARRAEYLDRYSTTVFWKIEFGFREIETFFVLLKVTLLAVASAWLYNAAIDGGSAASFNDISHILGLLIGGVLGWIVFARARNDFLTESFSSALQFDLTSPDDEIADVVRARISDIAAREEGTAPEAPSSESH